MKTFVKITPQKKGRSLKENAAENMCCCSISKKWNFIPAVLLYQMPASPRALKTRGQSEPRIFQAWDIDLSGRIWVVRKLMSEARKVVTHIMWQWNPANIQRVWVMHPESHSPQKDSRNTTVNSAFPTGVWGKTVRITWEHSPNTDSSARC